MSDPQKISFEQKSPPTDPAEIHFKQAWQHRKHKRYPEAVVEFQESLKHSPEKAATHFNLAWVFDALGEGARATTHMQKAEALFHQQGDARNHDIARNFLTKLDRKYPDLPTDQK